MEIESRLNSGAGWFFWIAGLSLINSIIVLLGSDWYFVIGLAYTQIIDEIIGSGISFFFDLIVAGIFVFFGIFAKKRNIWSFVVGMILYGLDGLVFLLVGEYLSFGFHIFALYFIYGGLNASRQLDKMGL